MPIVCKNGEILVTKEPGNYDVNECSINLVSDVISGRNLASPDDLFVATHIATILMDQGYPGLDEICDTYMSRLLEITMEWEEDASRRFFSENNTAGMILSINKFRDEQ